MAVTLYETKESPCYRQSCSKKIHAEIQCLYSGPRCKLLSSIWENGSKSKKRHFLGLLANGIKVLYSVAIFIVLRASLHASHVAEDALVAVRRHTPTHTPTYTHTPDFAYFTPDLYSKVLLVRSQYVRTVVNEEKVTSCLQYSVVPEYTSRGGRGSYLFGETLPPPAPFPLAPCCISSWSCLLPLRPCMSSSTSPMAVASKLDLLSLLSSAICSSSSSSPSSFSVEWALCHCSLLFLQVSFRRYSRD